MTFAEFCNPLFDLRSGCELGYREITPFVGFHAAELLGNNSYARRGISGREAWGCQNRRSALFR
jgi:hypothetical protein